MADTNILPIRESGMSTPRRRLRFKRRWLGPAAAYLTMTAIAFVVMIPLFWMLSTSLKERWEIFVYPPEWIPQNPQWGNYIEAFTKYPLGRFMLNSLILVGANLAGELLSVPLVAYGFARLRFPGRNVLQLLILALLVIPIQTTLVPVLQFFNQFRLTGTYIGIWIAHTAYGMPFSIYLLTNFFSSLPRELLESAKIDGASEWVIFARIVIPLSVPALASLAIFQFMWVWNDLLIALIFMSDPATQPVTVRIQALLGTYATEWHIMSAAAFISMSVPLLVFFALQRYFVTGLTAGAVKA